MRLVLQREAGSSPVETFINFVYQPIKDAGGTVTGIFVEGFDVTDRVQAELALQTLNETLEARVAERANELRNALARLQAEVDERERAEDALRQAQKMEAVGQLTGGIAHDFNNLLTVILGGLERIQRSISQDDKRLLRAAELAIHGAKRAATLTHQLLAFSRRQPLDPKPTDVNRLVSETSTLLHRTLGEMVELEGVLAPRLWLVDVDRNQLENALLNLAINARDAMPNGGKLTIETANTYLDEAYVASTPELPPGQYVAISISDTGCGIPPDVLEHVFEPFFTTKEAGRGTGLGLSQVYGFIKQSDGNVRVYSEPGHGTTVRLYLPRYYGELAASDAGGAETEAPRADGEVVLVVEDDEHVRSHTTEALRELGYTILEAADATAASRINEAVDRIDLLFTDVVLPGGCSGRELAERMLTRRPSIKVLFTTGYARNAIVHHGRLDPGTALITEPFSMHELAVKVRSVLNA
jgi:signal transduction histidine kinase